MILTAAHRETPARAAMLSPTPAPTSAPPHFRLPFTAPPGLSTWYVSQFFGNTPFALTQRYEAYSVDQGFHSGIDFATRCGTPVVAIGDGLVVERDNLVRGAGPHNLSILHPGGYVSFYGHLLEKPTLDIADEVKAGQQVALTGDPDETCHSRPHLHLEIRDTYFAYAFNPVTLIDADWESLALFGPDQLYARDLDNPRQWVFSADQPTIHLGGPLLNAYPHPWPPPDW